MGEFEGLVSALDEGRYEEALRDARRALERGEESFESLYIECRALAGLERMHEARAAHRVMEEALEEAGPDVKARALTVECGAWLAMLAGELESARAALDSLEAMVTLAPRADLLQTKLDEAVANDVGASRGAAGNPWAAPDDVNLDDEEPADVSFRMIDAEGRPVRDQWVGILGLLVILFLLSLVFVPFLF
jgi:hypothetical protein